ncbi:hypothetical protein AKI39_21585 [Bordetella sp. H567]|uniref:mandelate racemase/muconate lactonizing enzyme family protein n=1 Tax=Bordetella sp. H567 TaxID=1697043 RepID=UPI00081C69D1|nr:mandelate racemase/muconate lactonizing enzyme family protein [Bordetella sp. H567]AOB32775.1 hypothetical protein AKI39_21585 [Bordetella sp. H567]
MKIADIRPHIVWTSQDRSWLFVEVETDTGMVGLGEASQSRNDKGVVEELNRLAPQYVGHDPCDLIESRQGLLDWPYSGRTFFAAVSALEQALWDLAGKQARMPVYQLMGGSVRDQLRTYANIGYAAAGRDAESLARVAMAAVAEGYDAIKFYPFGIRPVNCSSTDQRAWISQGIDIVRAVRGAVGDSVDVLIDLMHQFQDYRDVLDIVRRVDPYHLYWVEDPFMHDDPVQLSGLRQAMGPRLAGGAPLLARHDWRSLLEARAFDVIMPDVKWTGGINQVKKIAGMAEVYGAMVSPHSASGPVAAAASVHAGLSMSNFLILEHPWGVPDWRSSLSRHTECIRHGYIPKPSAPGLGIELDLAIVAVYRTPADTATASGVTLPVH